MGVGMQSSPNPTGQEGFQSLDRELRKQPAIERSRRAEIPSPAKQAPQQDALALTPLCHCFTVVAITEQCCHQTGEQKRQIVTPPMSRAGIRKRGKGLEEAGQ